MLIVIKLSVVMLNVLMLIVVAPYLQWQSFFVETSTILSPYFLRPLGQCDTKRNDPTCVMSPKVTKASMCDKNHNFCQKTLASVNQLLITLYDKTTSHD